MSTFQSTKVFDGFSTVFRQWKAEHSHCKYLHGYAISFKLWFEGELDEKNWVWDFGGFSRSKSTIEGLTAKQWMKHMFDHTLIVAEDDPALAQFIQLDQQGLVQLRVVSATGAECFARLIYEKVNPFILKETQGRVQLVKVEFRENDKNSAFYSPENS